MTVSGALLVGTTLDAATLEAAVFANADMTEVFLSLHRLIESSCCISSLLVQLRTPFMLLVPFSPCSLICLRP
jgi:uncharacterized protein YjbI with pentapeptide repeats